MNDASPMPIRAGFNPLIRPYLVITIGVISPRAVATYLCGAGLNGRLRKWPHRVVACDDAPHVCINHTGQVTMMNRNCNRQTNTLRPTWAAGIGCALIAALIATLAHAEDTGVKADAKRAGQTVGATARDVGNEAKTAAPGVWQSMKNAGKSIAAGAKKAGTEIKPTAKKVGTEIGTGAKKVGKAAKDGGKKVKGAAAGEKKAG